MHHITNKQLRRRLALGLTIPPPTPSNNRRRVADGAIMAGLLLWLAGWICCLAFLAATGR